MDRAEVDGAVRSVMSTTADAFPWSSWARRWMMGIDRTLAAARKYETMEDEHGFCARAAVLWLEAQNIKDADLRLVKEREAWRYVQFALGIIP